MKRFSRLGGRLTGTAVQRVPLHALSVGEGGHVGVGVDALLHVAAPHALRAAAGALAAGGPRGARRPALLGAVVGCGEGRHFGDSIVTSFERLWMQRNPDHSSRVPLIGFGRRAPTWPLAQAAVHRVDAGLRLQPAGGRLGQVAAEAGVAGLPGEPLQGGVGEGRHVLPAPVRHVDFPEPHPRRHRGLVLRTHTHNKDGHVAFRVTSPSLINGHAAAAAAGKRELGLSGISSWKC